MSYVNLADAKGDIEAVKNANELINNYLGFDGIYETGAEWLVRSIKGSAFPDGSWRVAANFPIVSLDSVMFYSDVDADGQAFASASAKRRVLTLTGAPDGFPHGLLHITGTRGWATLEDLAANTTVEAGETIVDSTSVTLAETEYSSVAGDKLVLMPAPLRLVGTGVATNARWLKSQITLSDGQRHLGKATVFWGYTEILEMYK